MIRWLIRLVRKIAPRKPLPLPVTSEELDEMVDWLTEKRKKPPAQ